MTLDHLAEQRLEPLVIGVVFVNLLSLIAAANNMIELHRESAREGVGPSQASNRENGPLAN